LPWPKIFPLCDSWSVPPQSCERVLVVRSSFYVFRDQDSGLNHSFPSGLFGNLEAIHIDAGCIDDPVAADGCSTDPDKLDRVRGTVLQIAFDPLSRASFAGLNFEDPEHYGADPRGVGFDLRGATHLVFSVRATSRVRIKVIAGLCTSPFFEVPSSWTEMRIALSSLTCASPFDLANVHQPFGVVTDGANAPAGDRQSTRSKRTVRANPQRAGGNYCTAGIAVVAGQNQRTFTRLGQAPLPRRSITCRRGITRGHNTGLIGNIVGNRLRIT